MNAALLVLCLLADDPASASAPVIEEEVLEAAPPLPPELATQQRVSLEIGAKLIVNSTASFDKVSASDGQAFASIALNMTAVTHGRFAFAIGARWEPTALAGRLRLVDTAYTQHRMLISLEARVHARPWFYVFARFAPGLAVQSFQAIDPSAPLLTQANTSVGSISGSAVSPAIDATAGIALLAVGHGDPARHRVRWWWLFDAGYAWTGPARIWAKPALASDDPRTAGATDLGLFRSEGPVLRLATAISY